MSTRVNRRLRGRLERAFRRGADVGMATAEYAVTTLAAVGFAGVLLSIQRSGAVRGMLVGIIHRALSI
jgi:hypothetical protein